MRRFVIPAAIAAIAIVFVIVLAVGVSGQGRNNSIAYSVASRQFKPAPDDLTQLPVLSGVREKTRSFSDYRGKVVLVNFFAGWCDGCQEEVGVMAKVQKLLAKHGGTVLGVTYQDASSDALGFMRKHRENYPVLGDPEGKVANSFNFETIPDSYVIARNGKIEALNEYPLTMAWVRKNLIPIIDQRS